jgi:mono/diheme cytochrome c family protein
MTNGRKALRILLAGSVLMVSGSAASWAGEAKAGKATYDKLCASCHGADGKGNPAMAKTMGEKGLNLTTKEAQGKKDDELLKIITQGEGKMPASGKNLSKQEQTDVLTYVRSFGK